MAGLEPLDSLRRRVIRRTVAFLASVPDVQWTDTQIDLALRNAFVAEMFELWEQRASDPQPLAHLSAARAKFVETFINKSHAMGEWIDELDALHWALITTGESNGQATP